MKHLIITMALLTFCTIVDAQEQLNRRKIQLEAFQTDTPMVHDPVMAKDGDTYFLFCTGIGIQQMTSLDRKTWTVSRQPVMTVIPGWATDSVPGFSNHVWAPDVIRWHDKWWMAYSCSTFGKNGSAIGLISTKSLHSNIWKDEGCIVTSHTYHRDADGTESGDNWNAIDPNFIIDENDQPWMVWGSFWDGIQMARLLNAHCKRRETSHHCTTLRPRLHQCSSQSHISFCRNKCHRSTIHLPPRRILLSLRVVGLLLSRCQEQLPSGCRTQQECLRPIS